MTSPTKKLGDVLLLTAFLVFSGAFMWKGQYWISFLTLIFVIIFLRVDDLIEFSLSRDGLRFNLKDAYERMGRVLRSDEAIEKKVEQSQALIDEIFKAGYTAAGGNRHAHIFDVKIYDNENGNRRVEYSES